MADDNEVRNQASTSAREPIQLFNPRDGLTDVQLDLLARLSESGLKYSESDNEKKWLSTLHGPQSEQESLGVFPLHLSASICF